MFLSPGHIGWRAKLETMIYLGQTANELCMQNSQTQAVCETRSMMQGKGHFNLWGFRIVMLLRLTMTQSHHEKMCHVSSYKCPQRVHSCQSLTIWRKFNPRVWTEAEFWNGMFEFCLPERLNAFLWQRFSIPVERVCWYSRGSQLPWPRLCPSGSNGWFTNQLLIFLPLE